MSSCTKKLGGYPGKSIKKKTKGGEKSFIGGKSCKKGGEERGGILGGKKTKSKRKTKGKKTRKTRRKTAKKSFLARLFKL